jgi:hypothetical protein
MTLRDTARIGTMIVTVAAVAVPESRASAIVQRIGRMRMLGARE